MNELLDLREKLQDTHATMARLREAMAATPNDEGLALMAESLVSRQENLEGKFSEVANTQQLDVCKYRLLRRGRPIQSSGCQKFWESFRNLLRLFLTRLKRTSRRLGPE